ncbi:pseudouridine synthase, family 1 [Staphylococcus aureus W85806_020613]|nr:pseudouridine synthase, family 1 [Staphylococcus aureus W85806_020613]
MRIDKFLANMGVGTRNEVKQLLKKGLVNVNEQVIKSPKTHIEPENDKISVRGELIEYVENVYIMLNKPKGYISATEDHHSKTVIDLIPEYQHLNIFPVGRLDKDTEGLLLITNDGDFNHELMSPNKHVSKKYEVISKYPITEENIKAFKEGIMLSDGKVKPAILTYIDGQTSHVTIYEGKYHIFWKHVCLDSYISATEDHHSKTVIDLIPEYQHLNIFPVGRLDKDTEGLLLITNDGDFNHELMSPNKHVSKKYEVISKYPITEENIKAFKEGIMLSDGKVKPAILTYIDGQTSHVTIYEGKYHQVKRMFHSIQNEVIHLKRIKIADLELDSNLESGNYRLLTENDFDKLNYK